MKIKRETPKNLMDAFKFENDKNGVARAWRFLHYVICLGTLEDSIEEGKLTNVEIYMGKWLLNSSEDCCSRCAHRSLADKEQPCKNLKDAERLDDEVCLKGLREYAEAHSKIHKTKYERLTPKDLSDVFNSKNQSKQPMKFFVYAAKLWNLENEIEKMEMTDFEMYMGKWLLNSGEDCCSRCAYRSLNNGEARPCENLKNGERIDEKACLKGLREYAEVQMKDYKRKMKVRSIRI